MKVALCFIISNKHILNKEEIWKKWIDQKKDLFNVYFHYKDYNLIKSNWIRDHCLPPSLIAKTSYYHVVPAYTSILNFAFRNTDNKWFCLLTESCVPIVPISDFVRIMEENISKSIMSWSEAYWNINIHTRANLRLLKKDFQLANTPWFIFSRDHVNKLLYFLVRENSLYKTICHGGLANESVFAIALQSYKDLSDPNKVLNEVSTLTDWEHMESPTSPYLFKNGSSFELDIINNLKEKHKFGLFLRKVSPQFPSQIIEKLVFEDNKTNKKIGWFIGSGLYLIGYLIVGILYLTFPSFSTIQASYKSGHWFIR